MRAREKCAVQICPAIARWTVLGDRYCESCAKAVEQAAYFSTLPAKAAETVRYRGAMVQTPPEGVSIPEPLATIAAPRSTGRGRR